LADEDAMSQLEGYQAPEPLERARFYRSGIVWLVGIAASCFAAAHGAPAVQKLPLLLLSLSLASLVHLLGFALAGGLAGARLLEFSFFLGSTVCELPIGKARVVLRWLPAGGYVRFQGMNQEESLDEHSFHRLSVARRVLIILAGPAALMLLSGALLGWDRAGVSFLSAYGQFAQLIFSPLSGGKQLMARMLDRISLASFLGVTGVLAAKVAAWNVLPIPNCNGGQIIAELLRGDRTSPLRNEYSLQAIGVLLQALAFVVFGVALVAALLGHPV
jgi:membrane-associated protease RseP (regulator of RpoE activity)